MALDGDTVTVVDAAYLINVEMIVNVSMLSRR